MERIPQGPNYYSRNSTTNTLKSLQNQLTGKRGKKPKETNKCAYLMWALKILDIDQDEGFLVSDF